MNKHNCKQLRKVEQHFDPPDFDVEIFIRDDNMWKLSLFDKKKRFMGMGVAIEYCPFCGCRLQVNQVVVGGVCRESTCYGDVVKACT